MSGGIIGKVSESNNTHLISNTFYAVCETASNTTPKIAKLVDSSINSITLIEGMFLTVKFLYENTDDVNIVSLKIQSSAGVDLTGTVRIKKYSVSSGGGAGIWSNNSIVTFVYDGSFWVQTQAYAEQDGNDKVMQGMVSSANNEYEVLLAYSAGTTVLSETEAVNKSENLLFNPSTKNLSVGGTVVVGAAPSADMQVATKKYVDDQMGQAGLGTVTSITAGTALQVGDGTGSQSITTTGTLNHAPSGVAAKSTLGVYPITFNAQGHITSSSLLPLIVPTDVYVDGMQSAATEDEGWGTFTINRFGVCSTAGSTTRKYAHLIAGNITDPPENGTRVTIQFLEDNTVRYPTLAIDGGDPYDISLSEGIASYLSGVCDLVFVEDEDLETSYWVVANDNNLAINNIISNRISNTYSSDSERAMSGIAVNAALQTLDSSISATTNQAISAITITDGKIASSSKISIPTVTDTYSSSGTNAVSGKAVNAALQTLDSSISATSGQAISAITITDGKIASSSKISVGETNQNAFSNVKVGSDTIAADSTTDTLELVAGTGITLTADTTNDKVTITSTATGGVTDVQVGGTSIVSSGIANLITNSTYNSSSNKIATMNDISDTKVTNTLGTTTKYYVTGTTSSTTNTGTQTFDTGIYSTTTAGQLNATTYKVNEQVTLQWNSTDASLDFIFS